MRVGTQSDLRRFLADIKNYEIRIATVSDGYSIKFVPSQYPGGTVKGGGAKYVIQKCTREIKSVSSHI